MGNENRAIEEVLKRRFEDYMELPSEQVWSAINKKLWRRNFTSFSLKKFNVYYVSALTILVGAYAFLQFNPSKTDANLSEKTTITTNIESNTETNTSIDNSSIKKEDPKPNENNTILLPVADFSANAYRGCAPLHVEFTNKSLNSSKHIWKISDGNSISKKHFSYTFTKPGKYDIELTSMGENGKTKIVKTITVVNTPTANFNIDKNSSKIKDRLIAFNNNSANAVKYNWIFGDDNSSNENNPTHQYKFTGKYNIQLVAESSDGCKDTVSINTELLYEECYLKFPNVFIPSLYRTNINNEIPVDFTPDYNGISEYLLEIKSSSGQVIFTSNNPKEKWRGIYRNMPAPKGFYTWFSKGVFSNGNSFKYTGEVNLLIPEQQYNSY